MGWGWGNPSSSNFDPAVVVLLTEFGKFSLSLVLFLARPNTSELVPLVGTDPIMGDPQSYSESLTYAARNMTFPAFRYSIIDVMNLQGLAYVSLAHYAALHQSGIFFTAALVILKVGVTFTVRQYIGICLLFVGACFKLSRIDLMRL